MSSKDLQFYINQFDDYLDGKLDKSTLTNLQQEIQNNPDIRQALKLHIDARANIRLEGETTEKEYFLAQLKTIDKPKKQNQNSQNRKWLGIGILGLILIALMAYMFLDNPKENKTIEVTPMANIKDPSPQLLRSEISAAANPDWVKATEAFLNKDYEVALGYFEVLDNQESFLQDNKGKFNLLKGIAHSRLGSYNKAVNSFEEVPKDNPYYDQCQWYNAMNLLMADQTEKAKVVLNSISEQESHYKKKEAELFLKTLQ